MVPSYWLTEPQVVPSYWLKRRQVVPCSWPATISFQDAYQWWDTDGATLFKSSDAGQTWSVSNLGIVGLFTYQFIDSQHVWGLYRGGTVAPPLALPAPAGQGLAVTADGGLHWTQASVPDPA